MCRFSLVPKKMMILLVVVRYCYSHDYHLVMDTLVKRDGHYCHSFQLQSKNLKKMMSVLSLSFDESEYCDGSKLSNLPASANNDASPKLH